MTSDRVVVITGGASGMGAASARAFTALGDRVTIVDCNAAGAEALAHELGCDWVAGDVADSGFCNEAVDGVVESHGQIDVLVNAAGVIHRAAGVGTDDEAWRRVMAVNVDGVFFMARAALRHMTLAKSGCIVNFGSIWGDIGSAGVLAYCVSKGAVHQITRSLALEHASDGIRVNAVAPGEVDTPMLFSGRPDTTDAAELRTKLEATIPMNRLAQPEEIANVVVFLAGDAASYMTGAIVPVDAGYSAR